MATPFDYGEDCFYVGFELTSSNNSLVVNEPTAGDVTVDVSTHWYWNHNVSAIDTDKHGFLNELANKMNFSGLNNTYKITAVTPSGSEIVNSGIRIITNGSNQEPFTLELDKSTLDNRILGFDSSRNNVPSSSSGSDEKVDSTASLLHQWRPWSEVDGKASDKTKDKQKRVELASDDQTVARAQKLNEITYRNFMYKAVHGANVKRDRADDENAADIAGLPYSSSINSGDTHNAFELFWDQATDPGRDERLPEIIVFHDNAASNGSHDPSGNAEILRPSQKDQIKRPNETIIKDYQSSAEFYNISFEMQILNSISYSQ